MKPAHGLPLPVTRQPGRRRGAPRSLASRRPSTTVNEFRQSAVLAARGRRAFSQACPVCVCVCFGTTILLGNNLVAWPILSERKGRGGRASVRATRLLSAWRQTPSATSKRRPAFASAAGGWLRATQLNPAGRAERRIGAPPRRRGASL